MLTKAKEQLKRTVRQSAKLRSMMIPEAHEDIPEADAEDLKILKRVKPFTLTSNANLWATIQAVKHVEARNIPGDIVELGVWRGGQSMTAALTMKRLGTGRRLWLFDTFAGMPEPGEHDFKAATGESATKVWNETQDGKGFSDWCCASLEDVQANIGSTAHADVRYVQGMVEDTLKEAANLPETISILRLDTDWYESTKAELEILYPRLSPGGVLIIDDYGSWGGAKKAVDEYFAGKPIFLNRIDHTARLMIKDL
ncbi:TylF/MycF/NovP-related O-methyltransferase [Sphingomonas sp. G-3-2-10]|uniref:TylF/MycF/NovP-related O-methyltransferase n=1 Tax=Sphingomonas sp. G-3-2-10 TaxID=2728838 RepID=UPI0019D1CF49|nr:TylF/MycF/NovP-related O-methyltransferase [Sphingomonas sp. G-3-2-10]